MNKSKVTIVDYGMGNVWSVMSALKYLGADVELEGDPEKLINSKILILPGVGSFSQGMKAIKERSIDEAIISAVTGNGSKILGICLGMQLLGAHSTENGDTTGLGLIENSVDRFTSSEVGFNKIPHVGFNTIKINNQKGLFYGLPAVSDFYFTHSYRMLADGLKANYATCMYGIEILAAFESSNIYGTQFHPEKSQSNGLILLKNFLEMSY